MDKVLVPIESRRSRALGLVAGALLAALWPLAAGSAPAEPAAPPASAAAAAPMAPAASAPSVAATIPAERFFAHPAVLQAKLSGSGRYLGVVSVRDDAFASLLVVDLESTAPARVVATYRAADVVRFSWVGDERLLYRLGLLEPTPARLDTPGALTYSVGVDGAAPRQLEYGQHLLATPVRQPGVQPLDVIVGEMRLGSAASILPLWLDTGSGRTRPLRMPNPPPGALVWWFDSRGEPRLVQTLVDKTRHAFHWLAPGTTAWQRIAEFEWTKDPGYRPPFVPVAVTDDGRLYVQHTRGERGESVLTTFDFETMAPAARPLVEVPGFDFEGSVVAGASGQGALGVQVEADAGVAVWFDEPMRRFQAVVDQRLPGRVNRIECRRCGQADMTALILSHSDHDPGRVVLYRAATQRWENVATVMTGIEPERMASVEHQRVRTRDGRSLPVWLTLPPGLPAGTPAPAVVLVHDGPWLRGGYWRWESMAQFLASRGYLVIAPDFRGSSGYGEVHYRDGFKQWGQGMQDDLADALLWARGQGLANDRACIVGGGYGGYATLMGLARDGELYRCGIAWGAMADLASFVDGSMLTNNAFLVEPRRERLSALVGDPKLDAEMLKAASPLRLARQLQAPLLLAYGEEDAEVPIAHGERLRRALTQAGHPPQWVSYPGEGHRWRRLATRVDFARRLEAFLQQYLQEPAR